jgi:hypothetical protein
MRYSLNSRKRLMKKMERAKELEMGKKRTWSEQVRHIKSGGSSKETAEATDEWKEVVDPETNHKYYYNERTQETAWEQPGRKNAEKRGSSKETGAKVKGWVEKQDAEGRTFYYHRTTKEVTWDRPPHMI